MKRLLVSLVAALAALGLAQGSPEIRFIHLVEGVGSVDVWVDGHKSFAMEGYKNFTQYVPAPKGNLRVWVTPTGKTAPRLGLATVDLRNGYKYTLAALGTPQKVVTRLFLDSGEGLKAPSGVRIRAVLASPDAPQLNLYAIDAKAKTTTLVADYMRFGQATRYVSIPSGEYGLIVRPTGKKTVLLRVPLTSLKAGSVYSVYITGRVKNKTLEALLTLDNR